MAETRKATRRATSKAKTEGAFTDEELAAMKEHAAEVKASRGRSGKAGREEEAQAMLDKIADMDHDDRVIAERVHEIVTSTAPDLAPKLWYGMPAYAKDGKTICFYKPKSKFKVRYSTFGFQPDARLDEAEMWPVAFALTGLTPASEERIAELVRKAAG